MERVEDRVQLTGRTLSIVRPPDPADLIDEEAFARDEYMPYWAELWPSGIVLARAIERLVRPGERVVELGCGLGLPSIAAALAGAEALATDWAEDALPFVAENAARNGADLETAVVRWNAADELAAASPWDWVLAADVLYENRNVDPLLALLPRLGPRVLLADPGRPAAKMFFDRTQALWEWETLTPDPQFPAVAVFKLEWRG